jgi:hypothetical protein
MSSRDALLKTALDLLDDGIALLRHDGSIAFADRALHLLASHGIFFGRPGCRQVLHAGTAEPY